METRVRGRVIVADDQPRVLEAARAALARTCDVIAAVTDGAAAVEATLHLHPDVVVLDVAMPGLDGFQAAARIRAAGSKARIVFLANDAGDDFVLVGLSRGGSAFVSKTRIELDLAAAVGHVLAGRGFVPSAAVLPRWNRPVGRRHDLQFYASEAMLLNAVGALFEHAFRLGHSLLAVATEPHLQQLEARLTSWGADPAALAAHGRYTRVDAHLALEAVMVDGVFDATRFTALFDPIVARASAAAIGVTGNVTASGEMAPLLCARGAFDAMLDLERTVSQFASTRPLSVLCAYAAESVPEDARDLMGLVCAEHSTIVYHQFR